MRDTKENEITPVDEALKAGFTFEDHNWGDENESDSPEETDTPITELNDEQEEDIKSMPRKRIEEALNNLEQHKFDTNKDLYLSVRKSLLNALRPFIHEELGIIELESKRDPNQPTLRYETGAEVFELFPKPESKPQPDKQPAEIIELTEHQLPTSEVVQYNESAQMYEFPGIA